MLAYNGGKLARGLFLSAATFQFEPPALPFKPAAPLTIRSGIDRDHAVDLIKGVACLLMVLAHVRFADAPWLREATMASVLFFASTGMNLVGIVERRRGDEPRLAANALFLIFAGFADNYVQGTLWQADVFQSAGLAMLAMLLLRRLWPRYWTWLFPLPFLIHLGNQHFYWKIADGGVSSFFLTPGLFPLLPWLSFYLLGAHLKKYGSQTQGWLIGGGAAVSLGAYLAFQPFSFNKWWMSIDYFLIACMLAAWSFAGLKRLLARIRRPPLAEVRRWGANSLVFYILHMFVIRVLEQLMPHGLALFLLAVAGTALLLRPALALQRWAVRQRPAWVLLGGSAVAAAVIAANATVFAPWALPRSLASFGVTFSFIAGYPAWKNLSQRLRRTPRAAVVGVS